MSLVSYHRFGFEACSIQQTREQVGFFSFSSVSSVYDCIGRAEAVAGLVQCQHTAPDMEGCVFEDRFQFVLVLVFSFGQAFCQSCELRITGRIELFEQGG